MKVAFYLAVLIFFGGCSGEKSTLDKRATTANVNTEQPSSGVTKVKSNQKRPALMPWARGMYAEYLTTYKNGDWSAYKLVLQKQLKDDWWLVDVFIKNEKAEVLHRVKTRESSADRRTRAPIEIVGSYFVRGDEEKLSEKNIDNVPSDVISREAMRGEEPSNLLQFALAMGAISNFFSYRRMYIDTLTDDSAYEVESKASSIGLGIKSVFKLKDPWPEQEHVKYHSFSTRVPILGIASTECSDSRYENRIVAYGLANQEGYNDFDTYIDFDNHKTVDWGEFSIALPPTWMLLDVTQNDTENTQSHVFQSGGDNHALTFLVGVEKSTRKGFSKRCQQTQKKLLADTKDDISFVFQKVEKLSPHPGVTTELVYHAFKAPNEIGERLSTCYCHRSSSRVAQIHAILNFQKGNPRIKHLNHYTQQLKKMIGSFLFR